MSFPEVSVSGCFLKLRSGQLDCGRISHFENEKRFFHEFVMKNHLLHTYYLGFDWFCWMIFISTGNSIICTDTWHKYHKWYFELIVICYFTPLGEWNLRQFWNITSGTYAKYHLQIMLLIAYTTTHVRFVIFTCRYFKLSWNTTALSQSNCRNF